MDVSLVLAKILGLYITITALAVLVQPIRFQTLVSKLTHNDNFMLISALMAVLIGSVIIVIHNTWVLGWPVLVTIIGWTAFIRGIIHLFFPGVMHKLIRGLEKPGPFYVTYLIALVIGLLLLFYGFIIGA